MTTDTSDELYEVIRVEPSPLPSQVKPLLITASELRDRKTLIRLTRHLSTRSEAIRRLVLLALKVKSK